MRRRGRRRLRAGALQNVAKYSQASRATVAMSCPDGYLEFSVTDDGAGFEPANITQGTGLQGMTDRLAAGQDHELRLVHPDGSASLHGSSVKTTSSVA